MKYTHLNHFVLFVRHKYVVLLLNSQPLEEVFIARDGCVMFMMLTNIYKIFTK